MSLSIKHKTDNFIKGIKNLENITPDILKKSLEEVGMRIVVDAVTETPRTPILDGFLTGAYTVTVTGEKTIKPNDYPSSGSTGIQTRRELDSELIAPVDVSGMEKYELRVGNSMTYARRLHENPFIPGEWSQRRGEVGYKFLSSKLDRNGKKYKQLFAGFVSKRMQKI